MPSFQATQRRRTLQKYRHYPDEVLPLELWHEIALHTDIRTRIRLASSHSLLYSLMRPLIEKWRLDHNHILQRDLSDKRLLLINKPGTYYFCEPLTLHLGRFQILISGHDILLDGRHHDINVICPETMSPFEEHNPSPMIVCNSTNVTLINLHFNVIVNLYTYNFSLVNITNSINVETINITQYTRRLNEVVIVDDDTPECLSKAATIKKEEEKRKLIAQRQENKAKRR